MDPKPPLSHRRLWGDCTPWGPSADPVSAMDPNLTFHADPRADPRLDPHQIPGIPNPCCLIGAVGMTGTPQAALTGPPSAPDPNRSHGGSHPRADPHGIPWIPNPCCPIGCCRVTSDAQCLPAVPVSAMDPNLTFHTDPRADPKADPHQIPAILNPCYPIGSVGCLGPLRLLLQILYLLWISTCPSVWIPERIPDWILIRSQGSQALAIPSAPVG